MNKSKIATLPNCRDRVKAFIKLCLSQPSARRALEVESFHVHYVEVALGGSINIVFTRCRDTFGSFAAQSRPVAGERERRRVMKRPLLLANGS